MRSIFPFTVFLFFSFSFFAQNQWLNYANDHIIYDMALEGEILWVGTEGGLLKIDQNTGEKEIFQAWNSGLRGIGIRSIKVASDGTKWFGAERGGLFRYDGMDWEHYYEINTGDTLFQIKDIKEAPDGVIWFTANPYGNFYHSLANMLFSFDGISFAKHDENIDQSTPITPFIIRDFEIDTAGNIWLTNGPSIVQYNGQSIIEHFDSSNTILSSEERFRHIKFDQTGNLWCSASIPSHDDEGSLRILKFDGINWSKEYELGNDWSISEMFNDSNDNMWFRFGKFNELDSTTISKFNGTGWSHWLQEDLPSIPESYSGPYLRHVDESGNWWAILNQGINQPKVHKYDGSSWIPYDTEITPMAYPRPESLVFDCENKAWLTADYKVNVFDGNSWEEYSDFGFDHHGRVRSISVDKNTCDVWMALKSGDGVGVVKYDGINFTPYLLPSPTGGAYNVEIGTDGTVWVSTSSSGLGKFDGEEWTWYNESNSILPDDIYSIAAGHDGRVWVCANEGLISFDGNNSWHFYDNSNAPIHQPFHVFVDNDGMVWTTINQSYGLARFDGLNWTEYQLPNENIEILDFIQGLGNDYWIAGYGESYHWDGNEFTPFNIFNSDIAATATWEINIDPYGNTWFVNSIGISIYNENGISNTPVRPNPKVTGTVFFDYDQDGQISANNESPLPGQKVWLQPDNLQSFTNGQGQYTFYPSFGEHEVSLTTENPYVPTSNSPLNFEIYGQPIDGLDFGIWTADPPDSVSLNLTSGFARCNQEMNLWANFCNFGILNTEGRIEINFDPSLTYASAFPEPASVQGNTITFAFENLEYYDCEAVKIIFAVPGVEQIGEELFFSGTAISENGPPSEIYDETRITIACSFDPNDKRSEATGDHINEYSLFGDALDYTIRFQNKGNDTAFIVVIRDTLDSNLDYSSLQILGSSHEMETLLDENGVLTFTFRNINLLWEEIDEAGSQGFVKYRISPKENLPDPTTIENTAHIYFDFNPAIITNTIENILVETLPVSSLSISEKKSFLKAYPNPSSGDLLIELTHPLYLSEKMEVALYDLAGHKIMEKENHGEHIILNDIPPGFYILSGKYGEYKESIKIIVRN